MWACTRNLALNHLINTAPLPSVTLAASVGRAARARVRTLRKIASLPLGSRSQPSPGRPSSSLALDGPLWYTSHMDESTGFDPQQVAKEFWQALAWAENNGPRSDALQYVANNSPYLAGSREDATWQALAETLRITSADTRTS